MSKFKRGDEVRKKSGSSWHGLVVGFYSTDLTPEGVAVESLTETGSVQIYPVKALELVKAAAVAPTSTVTVDKAALGAVLQALVNHQSRIRVLQATREPAELFTDNPINVLIRDYRAAQ